VTPRRILFSSTLHGDWGGSEWLWSDAALRLLRAGYAVAHVEPWQKKHASIEELREAGAIEYCATAPVRWTRRLWRKWVDQRSIFSRALNDFRPDLVVISQARQDEGLELFDILLEAKVPYVVLNQLVVDTAYLEDAKADAIVRLYTGASLVCFVADSNRLSLEVQLGVRIRNAAVVRNPVRVPIDDQSIPPWPKDDGSVRLGLAGRLDPDQKGHDALFQALAMQPWTERQIWLHLYGHGSAERRLKRAVAMLGLQRVSFEPYASNPIEIWERCHVVAMPSRHEGTPIAMVEGMLMSRPVLGTKVSGIPEFVRHGAEGFLADACTPELIASALAQLWQAQARLQSMGSAARARALDLVGTDPVGNFVDRLLALPL
jgi:glycosyltransferase involved in cell wall biosynthesis